MARQEQIPGTERKSIKEVEVAGEEYRKARDARIKKTIPEKEKKQQLVDVMIKHGLTVYRDDSASPPFIITVSTKHNVKVTDVAGDDGVDEDAVDEDAED